MRKIILGLAVTLDGFIEGPGGEYDWCFTDQDYGMSAFFQRIDAVFYGRKSYELMLQSPDGNNWMPKMQQYVFSNSLKETPPGWTLVSGDILARIKSIREEAGKDIWLFGGASLTGWMINQQLVDELWLSVHPILLGSGKPLFSGFEERIRLQLLESKPYNTGLVSLRYAVLREA